METDSVKKEIKDVFYLIALQGINYLAPLLVLPYLMKVLGAEKFGYIGFALSITQYLMLIVDFGFNLSATKRIALARTNKEELCEIFSSTLYAKIGLLFISLILLVTISFIPQFSAYRSTMYVMFLTVMSNAFLFVFLFQGMGEIKLVSFVNLIAKLSILPLTFVFVKSSDDYLIAALLQALVAFFATLISLYLVWRKKWIKITPFIFTKVKSEIKESFPIFLSNAATTIYTASFVIVLGYYCSADEVGRYSAVDRIMRAFCMLIFVSVSQSFYPKISQMAKTDIQMARLWVKRLIVVVFIAMLGVMFAMIFLSPYFIHFLGKDYKASGSIFEIMAFVPIFVGIGGVFAQLGILALGNHTDKKNYQRVYFIAGFVAIVGVLIAVPLFKAEGAAFVLFLTEFLVMILMFLYSKHLLFVKNK